MSTTKLFKILNFSGTSFNNTPHHCLPISNLAEKYQGQLMIVPESEVNYH
uniref:Uncharacterized protein n=1 Tax=Solanum lycopersicum TaxID=4081 RepID=A0A3Q7III1_SOLLC